MKLCSNCASIVTFKDLLTNSPRMNATLIKSDEKCDDCGCVLK